MPLSVSIIVPCYNEQQRIRYLLDAIYAQTYPRENLDVTIADGHSTDRTREIIAAFQAEHPDLRLKVVDNDARTIPAALNRAMEASQGEIIVRLDAHSGPRPDYIEKAVAALQAGLGDNVGGVWEIRPGGESWVARSIAVAAAHPLGVGDALYRHATQAAYVDTVPFGAFQRSLLDKVGRFDESLLSNEDYEFNTRIRQRGGRVWLDPEIRSVYFSRATLTALVQQYFRYGFWKLQMLRRYPDTIRWRQALPPVFVLSLSILLILSIFFPLLLWLFILELALYWGILILAGSRIAWRTRQFFLVAGFPLAVTVMHSSWGAGFLWSILTGARQK